MWKTSILKDVLQCILAEVEAKFNIGISHGQAEAENT